MREILFRGKRKDFDNEWLYGFYSLYNDNRGMKPTIITGTENKCFIPLEVIPETVGQYTGLTDKNGKKIFEGDIVHNEWCFMRGYSVVEFGEYRTFDMSKEFQQGHFGFYLKHLDDREKIVVRKDMVYFANKCEIIGNIHDNPDLLRSENNENIKR